MSQSETEYPFMTLAAIERKVMEGLLRHFEGNKKRTARSLGVSRDTLYNKLRAYRAGDARVGTEAPAGRPGAEEGAGAE